MMRYNCNTTSLYSFDRSMKLKLNIILLILSFVGSRFKISKLVAQQVNLILAKDTLFLMTVKFKQEERGRILKLGTSSRLN